MSKLMNFKKPKQQATTLTTLDILPVTSFDSELEAFILRDGTCMGMVKVIPRDIGNLSDEEIKQEMYVLVKVLKTIGSDIEFVSMNFPMNLSTQIATLQLAQNKTGDEVRDLWLSRQISELVTLESNFQNRYYYMFYYSKTPADFPGVKENIKKFCCSGQNRLCEDIDIEEQILVLEKLFNLNDEILIDYK